MQTSQGYSFYILQHFATKFCNFTDFNKFFTGIYFFLPKSKICQTCKLSIYAAISSAIFTFSDAWERVDELRMFGVHVPSSEYL